MEKYLVGGAVRDELLGSKSKDLDYTAVIDPSEYTGPDPYRYMVGQLEDAGYTVFLETPEHFTVRAQTPDRKETADFVLAREEGPYSDGRRPDWVKPGTLLMDQRRRDFTMNAIAKASDGTLIDPFNGRKDITQRLIRAVGDPKERLREDALRAVRAIRFSVTKNMRIEGDLQKVLLWDNEIHDAIAFNIADERISDELSKMFRFDTLASLHALKFYPALTGAMFSGKVSLDSTLKTKGRGK